MLQSHTFAHDCLCVIRNVLSRGAYDQLEYSLGCRLGGEVSCFLVAIVVELVLLDVEESPVALDEFLISC
jgi:hypothetical protein